MPLRKALANSKNMVSIRILQAIGPTFAQEWITRFGFEADKHPAYLTMALGAARSRRCRWRAHTCVRQRRLSRRAVLISKLTDNKGRVLADPSRAAGRIDARARPAQRLRDGHPAAGGHALRHGGARPGTLKRADIYGKTGTTNDSMDAWFAGYQPSLVAVVWIGFDTPRKLGDRETGGGLALPVWIEFMAYALKGVPVQEPTPPEGVVQVGGDWMFDEFAGPTASEPRAGGHAAAAADARRAQQHPRPLPALNASARRVSAGRSQRAAALAWLREDAEEFAALAAVEPAPIDLTVVVAAGAGRQPHSCSGGWSVDDDPAPSGSGAPACRRCAGSRCRSRRPPASGRRRPRSPPAAPASRWYSGSVSGRGGVLGTWCLESSAWRNSKRV